MKMIYEPLCRVCNKFGKILCFCSYVVLCEECIGSHLVENPLLQHNPVALTHKNNEHIQSSPSISKSTKKHFQDTYSKQEKSQSILDKIRNEIESVEAFYKTSHADITRFFDVLEKNVKNYKSQLIRSLNEQYYPIINELKLVLEALNSGKEYPNALFTDISDEFVYKKCEIKDENFLKNLNITVDIQLMSPKPSICSKLETIHEEPSSELESPVKIPTRKPRSNTVKHSLTTPKLMASNSLKKLKEVIQPFVWYVNSEKNSISYMDLHTQITKFQNISTQKLLNHCAWTFHRDGTLIITGGIDKYVSKKTLLFKMNSKEISKGENMINSRHSHSQVILGNTLYVIGGISNLPLKFCEKYNFLTGKWKKVGNLCVARYKHGTCIYNGRVYVMGGEESNSIEVLNTVNDRFSLLRLKIDVSPCVLFPLNNEIVVLQSEKIYAYTNSGIKKVGESFKKSWWTSTEIVNFDERAHILVGSEVFQYESHKIVQLYNFN